MAVVAIDCGGTHLSASLVERATDPSSPVTVETPADAADIPAAITSIAARLGPEFAAVGVSIAGLIRGGDLVWMPHRDAGTQIASPVSAALGVPVLVDNDANLAGLAEAVAGAGVGHRMVLMVTVGTGIGGGLVIDGRIEHGRGFLGEIGHTTLEAGGPTCSCGNQGCWEAFASGTALDRTARALAGADPSGKVAALAGDSAPGGLHLVEAAAAGDPQAGDAFEAFAVHFGRGLANMVVVFDPDVIVVGGGVGSIGEPLLRPARAAMDDSLSGRRHRQPTPVVPAAFGTGAGIVGAALLAGAPA
jgi:glucokinase